MPPLETSTQNLFTHETITSLVVEPLFGQSVALSTLRRMTTGATELFLPKVSAGSAAFADELETLADADIEAAMVEIRPKKVGAVQIVSQESAVDANAASIIGAAIVAGLADATDDAFFNGAEKGPDGLPGITGRQGVAADPAESLDSYIEAIALIEGAGGTAGAVYVNPATWAALSQIKTDATSNQPVLNAPGALNEAAARGLFGVPVFTSRHCAETSAWVVDTTRTVGVIRLPFSARTSDGPAFARDGLAVRATGRVEFSSVYAETVVEISEDVSA